MTYTIIYIFQNIPALPFICKLTSNDEKALTAGKTNLVLPVQVFTSDCNLFQTVLLVIYITNLYSRKISTFYSVQRRNSCKKDTNFFAREEDRMTSVDSNFNFLCGRPHGA